MLCAAALALANVPSAMGSALRYDMDYPVIGYANTPSHNAVARLQARLDRGEVTLEFDATRGYLDSLLKALGIDTSSQILVFSKTSLQFQWIGVATPRAIYFNDDTYVAWVQGSNLLELTTLDSALGPVFYTLLNRDEAATRFDRETSRCLACHDTFSMTGGGVPRFLVMSSKVGLSGEPLTSDVSNETTDETPIRDRWAGWYVTGRHGDQVHLGNILTHDAADFLNPERVHGGNLDSVTGLFDTRPYITDKSDIVALLVLEHQMTVENLIVRANFKSRTLLARYPDAASQRSWAGLSSSMQRSLRPMLESVVRSMLFVNAAEITSRISSSSGFDQVFQARGPRDARGRSLRELDLRHRLLKYPLSYLVYSDAFDGLPDSARDYIYNRFAAILRGEDASQPFSNLSVSDRQALLEILTATKPEFARAVRN
jgi:hypothetical protein